MSHPNVAYILFLLGLWVIYFELSRPGAILSRIVGGIALVLALYAFSSCGELAGLALILFRRAALRAEVKVVSHGCCAGGAAALIAGSPRLFSGGETETEYRVDLSIVIPA